MKDVLAAFISYGLFFSGIGYVAASPWYPTFWQGVLMTVFGIWCATAFKRAKEAKEAKEAKGREGGAE